MKSHYLWFHLAITGRPSSFLSTDATPQPTVVLITTSLVVPCHFGSEEIESSASKSVRLKTQIQ